MTGSVIADKAIENVLHDRGARAHGPDGKTGSDYSSADARLAWRRRGERKATAAQAMTGMQSPSSICPLRRPDDAELRSRPLTFC